MRALVPALCGLGLCWAACTEQIELFPASSHPAATTCGDAAASDRVCGCVATLDASGVAIPCVCKRPCEKLADCPTESSAPDRTCDVTTGLCTGHDVPCKTRADCPNASDPTVEPGWLCISAK